MFVQFAYKSSFTASDRLANLAKNS